MGLKKASALITANAPPDPAALSLDLQKWTPRAGKSDDSPAENLSIEDRAEAERRFTVIEPLVFRGKFQNLWQDRGGRKLALVKVLAEQHGSKTRTIRRWLTQYNRHGLLGLVN